MSRDPVKFMERMVTSYDRVHNNRYWNEITPFIEKQAKGTVLDIGCGPGLLLSDLGLKFDSTKLIGIDLSHVMLEKANEILRERSLSDRTILIQQHIQNELAIPANLDLVVSSRVMRSFSNVFDVSSAVYHALNMGGKIVILDWALAPISTYEAWFHDHSEEFTEHDYEATIAYHRNFSRYSLDDWKYILEAANFTVEHSFNLDPVHCVTIAGKS